MHVGLGLGLTRGQGGGAAWTPAALFAAGGTGAWFDPFDMSTLWKDTAGTTPVTADGDLVARMDDKSGAGANATQGTSSKRPTFRTAAGLRWLEFDGLDDVLLFTAPDGTVSTMSLAGRLRSGGGDRLGIVIAKQAIYISLGGASLNRWGGYNNVPVASSYTVGTNSVMIERTRAANDVDLFTNGNAVEVKTTGTAYNARSGSIGATSSNLQFAAMDFYGSVSILRVISDAEVTSLKRHHAGQLGITL